MLYEGAQREGSDIPDPLNGLRSGLIPDPPNGLRSGLIPDPPNGLRSGLGSAAFMLPERLVEPGSWSEHLPFAFWLMEHHRPRTVVELGTHTGNSYLAFCQAVAKLDLPTHCYAIDTWRGDEQAGTYGEDIFESLKNYHDIRYASFSRLVRSTFDEALTHFSDGSVDLLHIDGLHTYEAVSHDFSNWSAKLSNRGIVILHDINVREFGFGVFRLWEELSPQYPHFEFVHGHGLGVLALGNDCEPRVRELLAAAGNERLSHWVRECFSRLGRGILLQLQLEEERARLEEERARYAREREEAIAIIEAYRNSTSWRLTSPFRLVGRFLKTI
jgi:Methyltransferase domain